MEIVGIGTDIVECLRIGRMIEQHGELFLLRGQLFGVSFAAFFDF